MPMVPGNVVRMQRPQVSEQNLLMAAADMHAQGRLVMPELPPVDKQKTERLQMQDRRFYNELPGRHPSTRDPGTKSADYVRTG